MEWGIFNDDSANYSAEEAVEADFYSLEEAEAALFSRYSPEDGVYVHVIEVPDDEDEDESEPDEDCESDDE